MKKTLFPLFLISIFLFGCGSSSKEETPDPSGDDESYIIETHKVTFVDASISGTYDRQTKYDEFKNYFNSGADKEYLSSISCSGIVQINGLYDVETKNILSIGSQKSTGTIQFTFNYEISEITLDVEAYSKYIDYNDSWSVDTESKLNINDTFATIDLSGEATSKEEIKKEKCTFTFPKDQYSKNLKLSTVGEKARVFIKSIELSFLVPTIK